MTHLCVNLLLDFNTYTRDHYKSLLKKKKNLSAPITIDA